MSSQDFSHIDALSDSDFEIFVRDVFVEAGWQDATVTTVGSEYRFGDGGVDIFASKNGRKYAIEVKQRKLGSKVDVSAINQLETGARLAGVRNKILVTNSYFTVEVEARALRLGIELVDRDRLKDLYELKSSEIGKRIKPRSYQAAVINSIIEGYSIGKSKFLIELATGLGKTYTIALAIKALANKNKDRPKVLFIAHQIEILIQSVTSFKNIFGIGDYTYSACFGGVMPEETDFVFGTFDTLYGQIGNIESKLFDIVIVDEAHHTPANTYSQVVQYFDPKILIGLTATPLRMDNKDVLSYFGGRDGVVGKYDLAWALKRGKLAFPRYMVMLDDINPESLVNISKGASISDVDKTLFLHKKDEEVVKIIKRTLYEKGLLSPKGIVFCRSISHAQHLLKFFDLGEATIIHSKLTGQQRRENLRRFREEDIPFILVCDLFNEGIDIPETNLLVFMRATGSRTIWLQQLGRGLRKTPSKEFVWVLDFVGSLSRLNDVKLLQKNTRASKANGTNRSEVNSDDEVIHDYEMEVHYNESAAQVLQLIEEAKYNLQSRQNMIESMSLKIRSINEIPPLEDFEYMFDEYSIDQISTNFGSYLKYIQAVCFDSDIYTKFHSKLVEDIVSWEKKFELEMGVQPSSKAIAMAFRYQSVELFDEKDLEGMKEVRKKLNGDKLEKQPISTSQSKPDSGLESYEKYEDSEALAKAEVLKKFAGRVSKKEDLLLLSDDERMQIREAFISEIGFLIALKGKD